jgi:hypothetical protein
MDESGTGALAADPGQQGRGNRMVLTETGADRDERS